MDPLQPDDIDRLFARLEAAAPPDDLRDRVLSSVSARSRRRNRASAIVVAAALVLITAFSFLMGRQLGTSGALVLLDGLATNIDLLFAAPADVALATAELVPWAYVAIVGFGLGVVAYAGHVLARPTARFSTSKPREDTR